MRHTSATGSQVWIGEERRVLDVLVERERLTHDGFEGWNERPHTGHGALPVESGRELVRDRVIGVEQELSGSWVHASSSDRGVLDA